MHVCACALCVRACVCMHAFVYTICVYYCMHTCLHALGRNGEGGGGGHQADPQIKNCQN